MHGCCEETTIVMTQGGRWVEAMRRHLQEKVGTQETAGCCKVKGVLGIQGKGLGSCRKRYTR
jgi:hypothetical protein